MLRRYGLKCLILGTLLLFSLSTFASGITEPKYEECRIYSYSTSAIFGNRVGKVLTIGVPSNLFGMREKIIKRALVNENAPLERLNKKLEELMIYSEENCREIYDFSNTELI